MILPGYRDRPAFAAGGILIADIIRNREDTKMMKKAIGILMAAILLMTAAQAVAEGTLTVQGTGVVLVDADLATVNLGVREIAGEVMAAQTAVNEKIDAVVRTLQDEGVSMDAISTNGIGIYPNYNYNSYDAEEITGYTAYNNIQVTVYDVDRIGAVIDAAFAAGANSLDYVEFQASDTAEASARALALAVESAKQKAGVLAEAAGSKLGGIVEIREDESGNWGAGTLYSKSVEEDAAGGTQVLASQQQVSATVSITFEIADS